jgi:hypothetical protein
MTLNANGTITGIPVSAGTFSFTARVTDSQATPAVAIKALSLTVTVTPLSISTSSLTSASLNVSYSKTLVASGGIKPYTWSVAAGSLPPGLILNTSTGAITGKPTVQGTCSFTVRVTDSHVPTVTTTKAFGLTVQ